jgi:MFS family permease
MALPVALKPLKPVFRGLWLAWLAANLTMWMNDVAAAWLMTSLTTSPVMVALVQTASTLPVFLLGLPSGALADILDRRRYFAPRSCGCRQRAAAGRLAR